MPGELISASGIIPKKSGNNIGKETKKMAPKSTFINREMLEPFVCDDTYTSTMVLGDELVGEHCINLNQGTLKPHTRLAGSAHEKEEIYYVVDCQEGAEVITGQGDEEIRYKVKRNDIIYIPGGCFHWINNLDCDEPFVIMTMWPNQEDNGLYHVRLKEWGTSFKLKK